MKRLAIFSLAFFFASCNNRTDIPKGIIPPDSMGRIMNDVIMAEEYSNQYVIRDSLRPDKIKANQDLLEWVFKIHHITRAEFKNSLNFYESRPDLNKNIFDSLATYSNRHKSDLYAPKTLVKPLPLPVK